MKRKITATAIALATTISLSAWADNATNSTIMLAANKTTASTTTTTNTTTSTQSFTPDQVNQIQHVIHDYLVKNPEVLIEASQALQMKEAAKAETAAQQAIVQFKNQLFNDPASPTAGNPNGTVTLVEFFDYQCIHCKAMTSAIQALVTKNPNLKVVFKELPIFGGNSQLASQVALAAAKQGKYMAFHDAVLAAANPITPDKVWSIASKVGLDITKLKADMNSPEIQKQIQDNFSLAQSLKLMGTPTFVLSDKNLSQFKFIPGQTTQDDLQQKITALTGGTSSTATTSTDKTAAAAAPANATVTASAQPSAAATPEPSDMSASDTSAPATSQS